jgi:hypothetical protein
VIIDIKALRELDNSLGPNNRLSGGFRLPGRTIGQFWQAQFAPPQDIPSSKGHQKSRKLPVTFCP